MLSTTSRLAAITVIPARAHPGPGAAPSAEGSGLPSATPRAGPAGLALRMRCPSRRHGPRCTARAVASPRSYWLALPSFKRLGQISLARVGEREG